MSLRPTARMHIHALVMAMKIAFVRTESAPDRFYVRRSDGSEVHWSFPTYGEMLPHDLVHLVVEAAFGVRRGFWGMVDAGVDPARANAMANRIGGKDKYRVYGEDIRELLLAEALAGTPWGDPALDRLECTRRIAEQCAGYGIEAPTVTRERFAAVRAVLSSLQARWRGLRPKGALELSFDAVEPSVTFAALAAESDGSA